MNKLMQPTVLDIVNENKKFFEPFSDLMEDAINNYHRDMVNNLDSYAQQENDEVQELLNTAKTIEDYEEECLLDEESVLPSTIGNNTSPMKSMQI